MQEMVRSCFIIGIDLFCPGYKRSHAGHYYPVKHNHLLFVAFTRQRSGLMQYNGFPAIPFCGTLALFPQKIPQHPSLAPQKCKW
jgi:hypothetical protein